MLDEAHTASGCDHARVLHQPRLLPGNVPSCTSTDLARWLGEKHTLHIRGAPCPPLTQGKIERRRQMLKSRILLENYYLLGKLVAQIETLVEHYIHHRDHESLKKLSPADVYLGRGQIILPERERIMRKTIQ
jgi:transposase InsO family protein